MDDAKVISAMEARRRFGEIMNRVALRGESYIIERSGKALVRVVPVASVPKGTRKKNMADPFENPFATFTEWNDPADDIYNDLVKKHVEKR